MRHCSCSVRRGTDEGFITRAYLPGRRAKSTDDVMEADDDSTQLLGRRSRWILSTLVVLGSGLADTVPGFEADEGRSRADSTYREMPALNAGLAPAASPHPDTPLVVFGILAEVARSGNGLRGARCLKLNAIDPAPQALEGPRLTLQLTEVLDQLVWRGGNRFWIGRMGRRTFLPVFRSPRTRQSLTLRRTF